ncbi:Octaprenyl-diphosphate synthase [Candidatus Providencia siddallii]|uniref:Octaprenyl diphosphate synthase n=1 Tax=Candidatus Providencia siddallii TaxID=1715285 RepID=A0A0M6W6U2_9GAMM|nr:Octaprenyl-diphosphate synthase [Candidatus Providencia siddallii]
MNKLRNIKSIVELITDDMLLVNEVILNQLKSDISLVNQIGYYIISNGGKRIRPIIVVLVGKSLGHFCCKHTQAAALIEFIHTASLLHDDVVDDSNMRRGKHAANMVFGNAASVLVGDFIYTRSFQMMIDLDSMFILKLISEAANVIAGGEILQLMNCNKINLSEEEYMQIIYSKTARLFEVAAHSSAVLSNASVEQEKALQNYGRYIGTAFQLIDDVLDYDYDNMNLDKDFGKDLDDGKLTLPLLHAMKHGNKKESILIREAIKKGNSRHLLKIIFAIMKHYGSLEYTYLRAQEEIQKAVDSLEIIDDSIYKEALVNLAYIVTQGYN